MRNLSQILIDFSMLIVNVNIKKHSVLLDISLINNFDYYIAALQFNVKLRTSPQLAAIVR